MEFKKNTHYYALLRYFVVTKLIKKLHTITHHNACFLKKKSIENFYFFFTFGVVKRRNMLQRISSLIVCVEIL